MISRRPEEEARETRIEMEIIVDTYGSEEQSAGWYCYLQDRLTFPFNARCVAWRLISPLREGDRVEVIGIAPGEECEHEIFVVIRWEKDRLGVPLAQLAAIDADKQTQEAMEDWRYWVERGYQF